MPGVINAACSSVCTGGALLPLHKSDDGYGPRSPDRSSLFILIRAVGTAQQCVSHGDQQQAQASGGCQRTRTGTTSHDLILRHILIVSRQLLF